MSTSKELITRLSRIEGQIGALKRALATEEAVDCAETLYQIKAATNGLKRVAEQVARTYATTCVVQKKKDPQKVAEELETIIHSAFTLS